MKTMSTSVYSKCRSPHGVYAMSLRTFALMRRDMIKRYCARFRVSLAQNTYLELHSVIQAARCPNTKNPIASLLPYKPLHLALHHVPRPQQCVPRMPRSEMMSPRTTFLFMLPLLTLEELGARGTHRFLAESQSSPSRSTPHAPAHEEPRVLEECETSPGLSRSG
jgi:hypothetical protein